MWNRDCSHSMVFYPPYPSQWLPYLELLQREETCPQPSMKRQTCMAFSFPTCLCPTPYPLVPICLPKAGSSPHTWAKANKFIGWPATCAILVWKDRPDLSVSSFQKVNQEKLRRIKWLVAVLEVERWTEIHQTESSWHVKGATRGPAKSRLQGNLGLW